MIRLTVQRRSLLSHIVIACEDCEACWYADSALNARPRILDALAHQCPAAQSDHEHGLAGGQGPGQGVAEATRPDPGGEPG